MKIESNESRLRGRCDDVSSIATISSRKKHGLEIEITLSNGDFIDLKAYFTSKKKDPCVRLSLKNDSKIQHD